MSDLYDWRVTSGGMFVWATGRDQRLDNSRLLTLAMARGACISPSSVFDPEGKKRRAISINFTLNPIERLQVGIRRLALATRAL